MDSIPVCVRTRPLYDKERNRGDQECWTVTEETITALPTHGGTSFTFDRCFAPNCATQEVYSEIASGIVKSAMSGYNGTIFCYGQTSSGKTYTMYGTVDRPGIVRLAAKHIYSIIQSTPEREYLVCASMVEIYNENIRDLLGDGKPCRIREDYFGRITLDAEKRPVSTPEQILAVLSEGEKHASRAAHNMNDMSSRSHTIFRLYIESKARTIDEENADNAVPTENIALQSELNLVDLAGSECAATTGAEGSMRREGSFINKSLLALSTVIEKLSSIGEKKTANSFSHVNFRDSTLTRMLQSSLGGNSKTAIICNVSLAPGNYQQTNSTLLFASRAKKIHNSAKINEVIDDKTELKKCKREICELKKQLGLREAELTQVSFQTMLDERDEKVRDLQVEREQLSKKLEVCMKMISVSNQPITFAKPEPFNRRFTLACLAPRNSLLSPLKPTSFEAPEWAGRPNHANWSPDIQMSESSSSAFKDADIAMPVEDDSQSRLSKKRKWSSGSSQTICRVDTGVQTDGSLEASVVPRSSLSPNETQELMQRMMTDAEERHKLQAELQSLYEQRRQDDEMQQQMKVKMLELERESAAQAEELELARVAAGDRGAELGQLQQEHAGALQQIEGLNLHIGSLTAELDHAHTAMQQVQIAALENSKDLELELEQMQAQVKELQSVIDEQVQQLGELRCVLAQKDTELKALRAQDADLQAQLAMQVTSQPCLTAEEMQALQCHVHCLEEECAMYQKKVQDCDITIQTLSTECREKEALLQSQKQAATGQISSLNALLEQVEKFKLITEEKEVEIARLMRELSATADIQKGMQARLTELTSTLNDQATVHQEQDLAASSCKLEYEAKIAAMATTQEAQEAELQQLKENISQRDTHIQSLQEEMEVLRLQHGALLREMASVSPVPNGNRKVPAEKLRDDNVAMQKQISALKNEILLKDRKLKAYEKGNEGRSREMEKLQARVKAADELLKQLRQEKGAVVQELVKKDAELKDCKRKVERVDKETDKFNATLKVERDRLKQVQDELQVAQKLLQSNLLEKQQLQEAEEKSQQELDALRENVARQEKVIQEQTDRIQTLQLSEQTLNTNLVEMAAMNQKASQDLQASTQKCDAISAQLQASEEQRARHAEQSKQSIEALTARVELLQQQLGDTNELQEILHREKTETDDALRRTVGEVNRLLLDKQVLEQHLTERNANCEALQSTLQQTEADLQQQRQQVEVQKQQLGSQEAQLTKAACDLQTLQQRVDAQQQELGQRWNDCEALRQRVQQLLGQLQAKETEIAELKEQQQEAEEDIGRSSRRIVELETDRDTLQMESENMREELENTKEKLANATSQLSQVTEERQQLKTSSETHLTQLQADLAARSNELRTVQLELVGKTKQVTMVEAEVKRLEAEWKADVQGYVQEFAEKERQFAKTYAENKFLTEEVEALQTELQKKSKDLEDAASKHEESLKASRQEAQQLQEQLEEASRQRRLATGKLEKELQEAKSQVAKIPALQCELQTASKLTEELQAALEKLQLQVQSTQYLLQQKDAKLTLAESLASDAKSELEEWQLRLEQKDAEIAERQDQIDSMASQLQAASEEAAQKEAALQERAGMVTQLQVQLADLEQTIGRKEKGLQALQQELSDFKKERNTTQLTTAQKDGEIECLRAQVRKVSEQHKQMEVTMAQKDAELEATRRSYSEQLQQQSRQKNELQIALEEAQQGLESAQAELAQSRETCSNLEMALEVDRRAHQRKVEQLEGMIQCAKERMAQTEQASQSEKVAHRRQTMAMSTTESQLRRLQADKEQLERLFQETQKELEASKLQGGQAVTSLQQLQESQGEMNEERAYLQERIRVLEAAVIDAGQVEIKLREKVDKQQEEMAKQRQKHDKAMKKLKESLDARYQMLKEKAMDRLDRMKRESMARKSGAPADFLDKENAVLCNGGEKFKLETEPLNLTEGERRVPRRSILRKPFAPHTTNAPKKESDSDSDGNTFLPPPPQMSDLKDSTATDGTSRPAESSQRSVHWAVGPLVSQDFSVN